MTLPQAIKHQEKIEAALMALLSLPRDVIEATERGGGRTLEKLLRCYHYWVEEHPPVGLCPYDHPRRGYLRMTPEANKALSGARLHCEHTVPINELRRRLRCLWRSGPVTLDDVRCVLDADEVVVLAPDEVPLVNAHGKTKMPKGWEFGQSHLLRIELGLKLKDADLIGKRLIGHAGHTALYAAARKIGAA